MEPTESTPVNPTPGPQELPPDNYLIWAILSTILCCLPLGIVSIVKSTEVNKKWQLGDREGAIKSAQAAKKWAIWSVVGWVIAIVLYIVLVAVLGLAGGILDAF